MIENIDFCPFFNLIGLNLDYENQHNVEAICHLIERESGYEKVYSVPKFKVNSLCFENR